MTEEVLSNPSTSRPGSPELSQAGNTPQIRGNQQSFRFTWERRRGPGSVSAYSEVESKADFVGNVNAAKGEIQALNSTSLSQGALGSNWSSAKHGFHAISTVLNHPTKRAAPPKAHSTLATVVPADLPRVRRKDFDPYLKDISPHWEVFQRNLEHTARKRNNSITQYDDVEADNEEQALSPLSPSMKMDSVQTARGRRTMAALDTVPAIFFEPGFNLTNPELFAHVTEQSTSEGHLVQDPAAISYSVPLMEKLSHYADTVEGHLVQEIQARSSSFFSALTNLHDLQSESERCLKKISELKVMLNQIDEKGAKKGLELVREDNKVSYLQRLEGGVKLVKEVHSMRGIAQGLAGAGEWRDALNVVENVQSLMTPISSSDQTTVAGPEMQLPTVGEESPGEESTFETSRPASTNKLPTALQEVSLHSLRAFESLPNDLRDLTVKIASTLSHEFAEAARHDLSVQVGGIREDDHHTLVEHFTPLVFGLMRTGEGGLKSGLEKWQDVVMNEIRASVKRLVEPLLGESESRENPDVLDMDVSKLQDQSIPLVSALVSLEHEHFMKMMRSIYSSLLHCLKGAKTQSDVILGILKEKCSVHSREHLPPQEELVSTVDSLLASAIFAATELAHSRVSKIISVRKDQHTKLKLREFYALYEEAWAFVVDCEVVCKRMVVGLRGTLGKQSTAFLQTFHADKLTKSAKMVEDELWAVIEVSPRSQRVANIIIDSAMKDAPELVFVKTSSQVDASEGISAELTEELDENTSTSQPSGENDADQEKTTPGDSEKNKKGNEKLITVDNRQFYIVSATMQVLGLVLDYLKVMTNLSGLTMECMSRIVEFLKAFNSRTCQVVLGAGAMRSAGLKNITARHLALASQSLSIIIALIPYIRENFRRHLSPKQFVLLIEFDKLRQDYQNHQTEIHSKLIDIMNDRLEFHCKGLRTVQWDAPAEGSPADGPNSYMQGLIREAVTLHKVLTKYLGSTATEPIMSQIFASMIRRLEEEYQTIPLPSAEAKELMLKDARFLHEKLSTLRGASSLSNILETIVQEKSILRKTVLNPNGAVDGLGLQSNAILSNSTPRPRGSIDLQQQPRSAVRSNTLGGQGANLNNIAARPSPFARRNFANLFGGGGSTNANSSNASLASTSTRDDSSTPGTPSTQTMGLTVGSSGVATPELAEGGRASPARVPSPPYTPSSVAVTSSHGFRQVASTNSQNGPGVDADGEPGAKAE
ncbi:hypothetical protein FRC15_007011 [Serendipita sp. 397]|nr:hypothetical protein FRC15_007011 [Serendipita sp. 397]